MAGSIQLLPVILGLVASAALVSKPPAFWSAIFVLLAMSGTLVAFSVWIGQRTPRSGAVLFKGASVLFATTIWLEFVLSGIETPLRLLLAFALAWMVPPFATFGLTAVGNRFSLR